MSNVYWQKLSVTSTHAPSVNVRDNRQQATGGRILIRCGTADVGLQIVRIGMDADSMFRCDTNDVRGVKGEQQRT